jgi:hypothetical protein
MQHRILAAGILAAALTADARSTKPADVTICVVSEDGAPSSVTQKARATVSWMFARIGVNVRWQSGVLKTISSDGRPLTIQVRFAREAPAGVPPEALANALPFGKEGVAVTVMYERIRSVARRSSQEAAILAHVLAHEIGHVLQNTNWHARDGVMKAHWSGQDFDEMERKPLEFTPQDIALIRDGLSTRSASR